MIRKTLLISLIFLTITATSAQSIIINEFMANPIGLDNALMPDGEWVELYNPNNISVNVSGWELRDNNDKNELYIQTKNTNTGNTIISAKGFLVVYRNRDSDFSLNSKNDSVRLFDDLGNLIDAYNYSSSSEGVSIGRYPDGADHWIEFDNPTLGSENIIIADTTPPVISNVNVTPNSTKATLTWSTNEKSDSVVKYGINTTMDNTKSDSTLKTVHLITIKDLSPSTQYYFQVQSTDKSNNTAKSPINTFYTTEELPPSIIKYTVSNSTISPNHDGIQDTTDIDLEFSKSVKYTINITSANGTVVYSKSGNAKNPFPKTWDGTDINGNAVPSGVYYINVTGDDGTNFVFNNTKTITVEYVQSVKGDFNKNGRIDIGDVTKVAYMVAGIVPPDDDADFNKNGKVDVGDAAKIAFYAVGKISEL